MAVMATARRVLDRIMAVITSQRLSSVVLYIVVGAWIAYRLFMCSLLGAFLADSPPNEDAVFRVVMAVTVAFVELSRIWRGEYNKKDAIAIVVFVLMVWAFYKVDRIDYTFDTVAVFAMRNEPFRRLTWFCAAVVSTCMVIVVAACAAGVVPDYVSGEGTSRVRHYLGFNYALCGPQFLFTLICSYSWLRDREMRWFELVFLAAVNAAFFILTGSRLSFILAMVVLIFVALRKVVKSDAVWHRIANVSSWGVVAMAVLSIIIVCAWSMQEQSGQHWLDGVNAMLGGRIGLTYNALNEFWFEPFGQSVKWVGWGLSVHGTNAATAATYNYVDNLYLHSLIERGAVYTVGIIVLYTLAARKAVHRHDYMMAIIIGVLSIHFLVDDLALVLCLNTLLFVCSSYLVCGVNERHVNQRSADKECKHGKRGRDETSDKSASSYR